MSLGSAGPAMDDEDKVLLTQLSVGTVIDGKYRVDRVLGRGAMGVVVQATHVHLGERVALKFLRYRAKAGGEDFEQRFKREAKVSAMLKNEHITRVIDVGVWRDRNPYMVMDYLNGTDLRDVMKVACPLPIGTAIDYAVQVCVGIAEAHAAGIVHRDLKPSNLFVTKRPDGSELIKILDFGISKWRAGESDLDDLTQTGVVLGSPRYMAPEQLFGSADVDPRADVWSIGAILYEMLCGKPPYDLPSFTRICAELSTTNPPPRLAPRRAEVTPELEGVVMKCFERDPDKRTRDVSELAGSLLDAVQAPFAAPMRQKIAAILDSGTAPRQAVPSGAFAVMTTTGSHSSRGGGQAGPLTSSLSGVGAAGERRRRTLAPWVIAAGLAVAAVAFFAMRGVGHGAAATATSATAAAATPSSPTASPPPIASAVPNDPPAVAVSAPPSALAVTSAGPPRPTRPTWRPPWRPPPPASAATVQSAPQASPAAPPAPTTDPLGDRQ